MGNKSFVSFRVSYDLILLIVLTFSISVGFFISSLYTNVSVLEVKMELHKKNKM